MPDIIPASKKNPGKGEIRAKGRLAAFNWADPLKFEDLLTEDERAIRDAAHAYCQEKLLPRVLMAFREERFDREIMTEMGALGFLGATLERLRLRRTSTTSPTA